MKTANGLRMGFLWFLSVAKRSPSSSFSTNGVSFTFFGSFGSNSSAMPTASLEYPIQNISSSTFFAIDTNRFLQFFKPGRSWVSSSATPLLSTSFSLILSVDRSTLSGSSCVIYVSHLFFSPFNATSSSIFLHSLFGSSLIDFFPSTPLITCTFSQLIWTSS